jgi:translation initiation factor IF-3
MATILVVDDELGIRALLSEILTDEGHTVELAENAAQARQVRESLRPDLVLLDIWMPDVDGVTLLKEWNSGGQLTMPVIMMSGHATIDTAVEATRIGALDFLEKPIALQKLLKAVEQGLDLVEVAATARPPVVRIMDYGKFKFEAAKQARIAKKKQHVIHLKEVKYRPGIDDHDFETKTRHARRFLEEGNKVKVTLMFRGRQIAHPELGKQVVDRVAAELVDLAKIESSPTMEGKSMTMILAPK